MCGSFALGAVSRAGVIDQNATHYPRTHSKEMRPVLKFHLLDIHEAKIGLMH
jgi:hypothetical protein